MPQKRRIGTKTRSYLNADELPPPPKKGGTMRGRNNAIRIVLLLV